MTSDQQLYDQAHAFIQTMIAESGNYEETLRYLYVLHSVIDQYMGEMEESGDDYPDLQ
ncbi:MAG: hypothetical protein ACM3NT_07925 [Methylocystaceae bacterium]